MLPLRIASSKSPDMPILSSKACGSMSSPAANASRHAANLSKQSMSPGAPIVISPFNSSAGQLSLRCRDNDKHASRSLYETPDFASSPLVSIWRKTPSERSRPADSHAVWFGSQGGSGRWKASKEIEGFGVREGGMDEAQKPKGVWGLSQDAKQSRCAPCSR